MDEAFGTALFKRDRRGLRLPPFAINLHLPRSGNQAAVAELARHIPQALATPARTA